MGMFDDVTYAGRRYQTKSLSCTLGQYAIRPDGSLWRETYTIEDRSDPNATGVWRFVGMLSRVSTGWEPEPYTGEVHFYGRDVDYVATFVDGRMVRFGALSAATGQISLLDPFAFRRPRVRYNRPRKARQKVGE